LVVRFSVFVPCMLQRHKVHKLQLAECKP